MHKGDLMQFRHPTLAAVMKLFVGASASLLCLTACGSPKQDVAPLRSGFETAKAGDTIVIPPGEYHLDGAVPIPLMSDLTIIAEEVTFRLPERMGEKARAVLFQGQDVRNLTWRGGRFVGHVFDQSKADNTWEPNVNTRGILITTSPGGRTENLRFAGIQADGLAGAAITVLGAEQKGDERSVQTYARNIRITDCRLERTGKYMWDYGYLWQIMVCPEEYGAVEHGHAQRYFRHDLVRDGVRMEAGDDRVFFANDKPLPVSQVREGLEVHRGYESICFFGDSLPSNIVRGRQYFVVESTPAFIRIADQPLAEPIRFASSAGPNTRLITRLFDAYLALYSPAGAGPGKGAIDLVGCEDIEIRGNTLSALGDTMHIQKSRRIVFEGNRITGSRMGAFFLAEFCQHAQIIDNVVDGTNGSRVVSIEKSCQDVVVRGNVFRNGGRGSWINQPRHLTMEDNVFEHNTTKCEPDPRRGRRSFLTGGYEEYAEMYFTVYEPGGTYGDVVIRNNRFVSGPNARHAITFMPGGSGILIEGNRFEGPVRDIPAAEGCIGVDISGNTGFNR
jgi:hypothetical protein